MAQKKKGTFGRKKAYVDWDRAIKLMQAHCSGVQIAAYLGLNENTLYNCCKRDHKMNYEAFSQIHKSHGKAMLKAKQFEIAMHGDKDMLKWTGKQYLGQSDNVDVSVMAKKIKLTVTDETEG